MPKEIWTTDAFGMKKELKSVIKDGELWDVDALCFPTRLTSKIDSEGNIWSVDALGMKVKIIGKIK